jgi:N-acetylglutamate synthase
MMSMSLDHAAIIEMETMANAAMPALETQLYDGWLLRFSQGYTKRANSVHPLHASTLDLETKIAFCESQYAKRGQSSIFKMTPASQPPELDTQLEARGYKRISDTLLQVCPLSPEKHPVTELKGSTELSQEWVESYQRLDPFKGASLETIRQTLVSIPYPTFYAEIKDETGTIIGIGQGVLQDTYIGIFAIVVDEAHRGRGLGRHLMNILLSWGMQQGAQKSYLQVSADNQPALPLYHSLGFETLYDYWYRIK